MIEVTIYNAITLDGYIAASDGSTDWVNDWGLFEQTCKDFGCITMGRSTHEEGGSEFEGVQHLILTSGSKVSKESVHFVNSVEQAIAKAQELGFNKLLVIGGPKTNESFIKSGKVNKMLIDVHSLVLGTGKKLFGDYAEQVKLKLSSSQEHSEGFVHLEYEVGKNWGEL